MKAGCGYPSRDKLPRQWSLPGSVRLFLYSLTNNLYGKTSKEYAVCDKLAGWSKLEEIMRILHFAYAGEYRVILGTLHSIVSKHIPKDS